MSPFGVGMEPFWSGLINGQSGVNRITQFPVDDDLYPCKIASEVPEFDYSPWISDSDSSISGRYHKLALTVLGMALEDARLTDEADILGKASLYIGSGAQTGDKIEEYIALWTKDESAVLSEDTFSSIDPSGVTTAALKSFNLGSQAFNITASCTSGVLALMTCVGQIQAGKTEIGVVVGADSISPLVFLGVGLTGELSQRNEEPSSASRPFDIEQDGYILGEGAVALVVETECHALSRGARIYAELGSFSATTDATSFKYIDKSAVQMARGMASVLKQIPANQIDYINAHGPSIMPLDIAESYAIRQTFGKQADSVPVTSIKGAIGNPSAAGGMLQLVSGILSIRDGIIPPTINLKTPLQGCDLDYVKEGFRQKAIKSVLIFSHGGGGFNAAFALNSHTS